MDLKEIITSAETVVATLEGAGQSIARIKQVVAQPEVAAEVQKLETAYASIKAELEQLLSKKSA
jgi:hypothetical protein